MKRFFWIKKSASSQAQPQDAAGANDMQAERERVEQERLARRAALRKMGMITGATALALISGDDLARLAGAQLKKNSAEGTLANMIARQLRTAGVAFAGTTDPNSPYFPADCQDRCDSALLGILQGWITPQTDLNKLNPCLSNCVATGGGGNCFIACFQKEIPLAPYAKAKNFLTCCYTECDAHVEGKDAEACKKMLG